MDENWKVKTLYHVIFLHNQLKRHDLGVLVGQLLGGTPTNCYLAQGTVVGNERVAGLAGYSWGEFQTFILRYGIPIKNY